MAPNRTLTLLLFLGACATPPPDPAAVAVSGAFEARGAGSLSFAPFAAQGVAVTDGLCFVACGDGGVRIVDVTDPTAPETLSSIEDLRADAIAFAEDQLWIVGVDRGLFGDVATLTVIDVIDPRLPGVRRTATFDVDGPIALSAEGTTAAIAAGASGAHVASRRSLVLEDFSDAIDEEHVVAALVSRGNAVFVGRSSDGGSFGFGDRVETYTLLLRDADNASSTHSWTTPAAPAGGVDLVLSGDVLLVLTGAELHLVDATDPTALQSLGALPLSGGTAIAASGALGAVARGDDVLLLDLDQPDRPTTAMRLATSGTATDVALLDDLLAVADGADGLRLYYVVRAGE